MTELFDHIKGCPLFRGLTNKEKDLLAISFSLKKVPEGKVVYLENMPGESLYIIRSGSVKVSRALGDGKEKTLALLGPEDMFGELALLDGGTRAVTICVLEDAELLSLAKQDFERFCDRHPKTAVKLLKNILLAFAQKSRETRLEDNLFLRWCFGEDGSDGGKLS
ncbi:MAG: cyclic nucleotide-binding domain-containing protein [Deltaproteobacteria bacterium]|nr:cyclic nucleotide-binding domain-containing protein [Deltaproteobacteria bacterium]